MIVILGALPAHLLQLSLRPAASPVSFGHLLDIFGQLGMPCLREINKATFG